MPKGMGYAGENKSKKHSKKTSMKMKKTGGRKSPGSKPAKPA
jgi:hypothetical protein